MFSYENNRVWQIFFVADGQSYGEDIYVAARGLLFSAKSRSAALRWKTKYFFLSSLFFISYYILFYWRLLVLKMLDFSARTRIGSYILTSTPDLF